MCIFVVLNRIQLLKYRPMGNTVIDILNDDSFIELFSNYSELVIDGFTEEGVLKDIPLFSTVYGLYKIKKMVNRKSYEKRIIKFLGEVIPNENKNNFITLLLEDEKEQKKAGESLFLILANLNHEDKTKIIAKTYRACLQGFINIHEMQRLCILVSELDLSEVDVLRNIKNKIEVSSISINYLASRGLVHRVQQWSTFDEQGEHNPVNDSHLITSFGNKLLEIIDLV